MLTETASITQEIAVEKTVVRYAWGNTQLATWFITEKPKAVLPAGSTLLFILGCEPTDKPLSVKETYPIVDDVISDKSGKHIIVKTINWI